MNGDVSHPSAGSAGSSHLSAGSAGAAYAVDGAALTPRVSRRAWRAAAAALIAFSVTVAPAALARSSPGVAIVTAVVALGAGVGGAIVADRRRALGRGLGIAGFVLACLLTWLLCRGALSSARLDPVRAAIGGLAWGAFALAWSDRRHAAAPHVVAPPAPLLPARSSLAPLAVVVGAVGAIAGVVFALLPWRVREPERAIVVHVVSVAAATAFVTAAATVAVARGNRRGSARRITPAAGRALLGLAVATVVGAVVMAVR